jgi:hypothetical protein
MPYLGKIVWLHSVAWFPRYKQKTVGTSKNSMEAVFCSPGGGPPNMEIMLSIPDLFHWIEKVSLSKGRFFPDFFNDKFADLP